MKARRHNKFIKTVMAGFTLLEMLVTIAIVGIVYAITTSSFDSWTSKKLYSNTVRELRDALADTKNDALSRNTTTKLTLSVTGSTYTITREVSATAVSTCTTAGVWTQISSKELSVADSYQITGSGVGATCFYRDGSSSGNTFTIAPIETSSTLETATITVTISTGYIDVTES